MSTTLDNSHLSDCAVHNDPAGPCDCTWVERYDSQTLEVSPIGTLVFYDDYAALEERFRKLERELNALKDKPHFSQSITCTNHPGGGLCVTPLNCMTQGVCVERFGDRA